MTNQVEQIIWLIALHQMDMVEEAANLTRFRHNFRNTEDIIFPEPKLCKRRVLIESWVSGESIATYLEPGTDPEQQKLLANRGADMLLQMVFHDNLWHGDLHPGNLLVTPSGQLAVLDSGITCSLSKGTGPTSLIHSELLC